MTLTSVYFRFLVTLHLTIQIHSLSCTSQAPFAGWLWFGIHHKMASEDQRVGEESYKFLPFLLQPGSSCNPPRGQLTSSWNTDSFLSPAALIITVASSYCCLRILLVTLTLPTILWVVLSLRSLDLKYLGWIFLPGTRLISQIVVITITEDPVYVFHCDQ